MVKAIYIPSDFNFHPEYERSFHWNLIVLEKSFVLSEETSGKKKPKVLFGLISSVPGFGFLLSLCSIDVTLMSSKNIFTLQSFTEGETER